MIINKDVCCKYVDRTIKEYKNASSFYVGQLPEGCKRCIKGEKIVLYTTGSCSVGCAYCPIPEDRQLKDDIFIDERRVESFETIVDESEKCVATGMGITGGDPMEVPDRTLSYIRMIKARYGEEYHLHLYTSGLFFIDNEKLIDELFKAGLDELRFHPRNLRSYKVWNIAQRTKERFPEKSIGFEVPAIPGREEDLIKLIEFADKAGLDFVNLNEFEFTESNFNKLSQRGFVSVLTNAAVMGSEETVRTVFEKVKDTTTITLHFCSSNSKDSIQLAQRYRRRASQVKRKFDAITEDGLIEYAQLKVWTEEDLELLTQLLQEYDVEEDMMEINKQHLWIETADFIALTLIDELREEIEIDASIVEKYPIDDSPIIRVDPF